MEMPEPELDDPAIFESQPDFLKNSLNRERWFWRWDTPEKYQINMRAYYRMISGYDNVMKRVLAAVKEMGFADNTVIIYSADNGYYMGDRGFAGKWSHYEESLRVPLIISDPRAPKRKRGTTSGNMALNIDIPATILGFAGISQPSGYQGSNLRAVLDDVNKKPWRRSFFCEHRMEHEKLPKYAGIHEGRYVYANYYEQNPPYEFLHDLEKDPDELENFAKDDAYQSVLRRMRAECKSREASLKGQ